MFTLRRRFAWGRYICIAFLVFTCTLLFSGYAHPPAIRNIGIEQGLSNNSVRCIYQDHNGFMWFGTYDGLNRYDGYSFRVYRNKLHDTLSLPHNYIYSINEDGRRRLWVGTGQGVVVYNRLKASFTPVYYLNRATGKREKMITNTTVLQPDGKGSMFIGTDGRGLLVMADGGQTAEQIPYGNGATQQTAYNVTAILADTGRVWVFINDVGLCRYDDAGKKIILVSPALKTATSLAPGGRYIWIGTNAGLFLFDPASGAIMQTYTEATGDLGSNAVAGLFPDKQGKLWIGTEGGGISVLTPGTGAMEHIQPVPGVQSLSSESVFAIYGDRQDRKWVGTLKGGIDIIDPWQSKFQTIVHQPFNPNSLVNNFVSCFYESPDKSLLIGTDGGGMSLWNRQQNKFTNFFHQPGKAASLSSNLVTSIAQDYQGAYWVATYGGGINKFNRATGLFQQYRCIDPRSNTENRNVWLLYEDRRRTLWATTFSRGQLYRYNRPADRFEMFAPEVYDLLAFKEDSRGAIWAGNFRQLIRIDPATGKAVFYPVGKPVRALFESSKKQFWLGTEGGGLVLFNRQTGQIEKRYADTDGLCNNSVLSIVEDGKGLLWLSTFNGLSVFNPETETFQTYYQSDGLQSNQFIYKAAFRLQSGELAFGGIKGFNLFHPDSLHPGTEAQPVQLTGLRIGNLPVTDSASQPFIKQTEGDKIKELEIPYDQAAVSFDFAALEYSVPDKISYAYYLKGWDKSWNYTATSQRTASYTRLKEGAYTLYLRSTSQAGAWSAGEAVMLINILPPWYRSWWAYLVYAGIVAVLIYLYNGYRVRQAKLEYDVKLARMNAEKEKELNEKKMDFFTEVSHEFRTPLTLIINPLKDVMGSGQQVPPELDTVYRNAGRLLTLVDQLLQFQKAAAENDRLQISKLDFYRLARDVFESFVPQAKSKQIDYRFICANEGGELYADRAKLEIVLFNLLSNAIKFTHAGGQVVLSVEERPGDVEVTIADNGAGIPAEVGEKLFERFYQVAEHRHSSRSGFGIGLYLAKHVVEQHKGAIWYQSEPGKGTTFYVSMRKGKAHLADQVMLPEDAVAPLLVPEPVAAPVVSTAVPEKESRQKPGKLEPDELISDKASLLIVEDDPEVRQYIKNVFRDRFIVYEAEGGEAGVKLARQHVPDIIISDVMMPGGTGIELCNRIKQDAALAHIQVILLTAHATSDKKLEGLECGADDYITKPFEKELLVARVANLLKNRTSLQNYFYSEITLQQPTQKVPAEYKAFLEKCIAIVEGQLQNDQFNIQNLARDIGMSHSNLYKKVKSVSGQSVNSFIRFIRLRKAAELFINTQMNVNETAFEVGIYDTKYFREQFSKLFGMNPSGYIKKYRKILGASYRVNKAPFEEGQE